MSNDVELRAMALQLCTQTAGVNVDNLIATASATYDFLAGQDKQPAAATAAPTAGRGRRAAAAPTAAASSDTSASATTASPASQAPSGSSQSGSPTPSAAGSSAADVQALRVKAKELTLKVAKTRRPDAIELLSKFDATSASDMPEGNLEAYVLAITAMDGGASVDEAVAAVDADPLG